MGNTGRASNLVEKLLKEGFENISGLDISSNALTTTQRRLGGKSNQVQWITSDEWTVDDLTVLRGYEWERINFGTSDKRRKLANMMGITEEELNKLRKDTFASVTANIINNSNHQDSNGKVAVDHHGDHRSIGAESYPGIKLDKGEPVSFGFFQ